MTTNHSRHKTKQPTLARQVADEALRRVEEDDAYANLILPALLERAELADRDAALATELTYGTLRNQGFYDAVIQTCARRSMSGIDEALRPILRMASHQLLAMRVPPHAAVDEAVTLARDVSGPAPASFTNAVLRRVSERDRNEWLTVLHTEVDKTSLTGLSIQHSHPEWVVRSLKESLLACDRDPAELPALLDANNKAATVSLALLPGLANHAEGCPPGNYSPIAASLPDGDPRAVDLIRNSHARIQDEGSQLAVLALLAAPITGPDDQWADLCAGPGGKSAVLAATAQQQGARLLANEAQPHRTKLVRQAIQASQDVVEVRTGDGREFGTTFPETFDRVLVDVPCTGLGALRRRPESRWRRQPADLAKLTPLQRDLLTSAVEATRPGGIIAYVTCSPHPVETKLVVADTLRGRQDLKALDTPAILSSLTTRPIKDIDGPALGSGARKGRAAQLWPHLHDTDAMFVALLQRM